MLLPIASGHRAANEARILQPGVDTIRQWRMVRGVEFIETPTFTRLIGKLILGIMKKELFEEL